jgi:hypothetical protein
MRGLLPFVALLLVRAASGAAYGIARGSSLCRIHGCVPRARAAIPPDKTASRFGDSHPVGFAVRAMPIVLRGARSSSMSSGGKRPSSSTGKAR